MKVQSIFDQDLGQVSLHKNEWYEVHAIETTRTGTHVSLSGPGFKLDAYNYMRFKHQEFAGPDGKPGSYLFVQARSGKALQVFDNTPLCITLLTSAKGKCMVQVVRIGAQQKEQTGQMTRLFPYTDFEPSHAT